MAKVRICFRIQDADVDKKGKPIPAGLCVDIGESDKEIDYNELTKDLDKRKFLDAIGLQFIQDDKIEIITPEEYDKEYGSTEEEQA